YSFYQEEDGIQVANETVVQTCAHPIYAMELARKYNIAAHETVRRWSIIYTKGEGLKTYSPKPEVYAMKSRNVTHDEKVKIVKDCLANELSYKDTAEKYRIPYNNVYSWVQKYKE